MNPPRRGWHKVHVGCAILWEEVQGCINLFFVRIFDLLTCVELSWTLDFNIATAGRPVCVIFTKYRVSNISYISGMQRQPSDHQDSFSTSQKENEKLFGQTIRGSSELREYLGGTGRPIVASAFCSLPGLGGRSGSLLAEAFSISSVACRLGMLQAEARASSVLMPASTFAGGIGSSKPSCVAATFEKPGSAFLRDSLAAAALAAHTRNVSIMPL